MGKKSRRPNRNKKSQMSVSNGNSAGNNVAENGDGVQDVTANEAIADPSPSNSKDETEEVVESSSGDTANDENADEVEESAGEDEELVNEEVKEHVPEVKDSEPPAGFISEIETDSGDDEDQEGDAADADVSVEPIPEAEPEAEPESGLEEATGTSTESEAKVEESEAAPPGPRPIVIAGPSGTGKGTLISVLMDRYPDKQFGFSVSHTTRQPREGEVDTIHYNFTTVEQMKTDIDDGKFIEHAEVHGNYYGTSVAAVQSVTGRGQVCILDIDVQGVELVKKSLLDPFYIFIAPPSMDHLEKRLRGRGTEKEEDVQKRLANAKGEMEYGQVEGNFDKYLINDDLDVASDELCSTVESWYPHLKRCAENPAPVDDTPIAEEVEENKEGEDSELPDDEADPKFSETATEVMDNKSAVVEESMEYPEDEVSILAGTETEVESELEPEPEAETPVVKVENEDFPEVEESVESPAAGEPETSEESPPGEETAESSVAEESPPGEEPAESPVVEESEAAEKSSPVLEELVGEESEVETVEEVAEDAPKEIDEVPKAIDEAVAEVKSAPPQDQLSVGKDDAKESTVGADSEVDTPVNPSGKYYTLEELKVPIDGVEWAQRQEYLSDEDFQTHFGFPKSEFSALPNWKKMSAKKKLGIF